MVRLAIVRGLTYTDMGQVRRRWLIPTYATVYRWTGNRADAEDLTAWIFHNITGAFRKPELVQVIEERLAELTSEAVARHWSDRYGADGVSLPATAHLDSWPPLETLLSDLTAEAHLTLVLRFVRRRPMDSIASQLRLRIPEAERRVFVALAHVAARIGLVTPTSVPVDLDGVSSFISDLVARRRPTRFEAGSSTWPALLAACHIHGAIAGNDLPSRRFVRSLETSPRRLVTELRIWSA